MNSPAAHAPTRFIRGRARGGGAYRPYFYFRRNGRTIPAGGRGDSHAAAKVPRGSSGAGWRGRRRAAQQNNNSLVHPADIRLNSSFLRPECYAAPEDAQQTVQSIAADMPIPCPGWHMYFPQEVYKETSDLAKRIKAVEEHYTRHEAVYDLKQILLKKYFKLEANVVCSDDLLVTVWPQVKQDMELHTQQTLATFATAMHKVVTMATVERTSSQQVSSETVYIPRCTLPRKIFVRPVGFQEVNFISNLDSSLVDNLCCVRGIVSAIGAVTATASWIAYKCSRCGQEQALRQSGFYTSRPYNCKREGCLAKTNFIEQRSSPFTRITPVQIIQLQDNNLQSPIDSELDMPSTVEIELRYDLVDTLVSGQDVIVTGVLKMRPLIDEQNTFSNYSAPRSTVYMKAASIVDARHLGQNFTQRDMDAISLINSEPDSFKLLAHSIAPELHGEELVKAGVLLSLFGGAGSQIHDESEINVLLVGDPGIGKSHLLEMCANISHRGTLLSAKRCSPTTQPLTTAIQGRSNHIINSGAIITSNTGHCAIDDIDRLASQQDILLQMMQSKMISLPFPNLYVTITAPTSIIAASNSLRGHYDRSQLLTENTRLSTALLQQFHLVFLLLDKSNKDLDTSLTEHIKAMHDGIKKSSAIAARFEIKPKINNSVNITHNDEGLEDENYDLSNRLKLKYVDFEEEELDFLPPILLKKFIAYARQHVHPFLSAEAAEALKSFYMNLREQCNEENRCTVSTSHFEGLIRLAQARARIDFSSEVKKAHVRDVLSIVRHSIADTATRDYIDTNPATSSAATTSKASTVKKFIQILQMRSSTLGRRIFDYDELKDMATRAGISNGFSNLVEFVNLQGYLLKKGPNMYEVMTD